MKTRYHIKSFLLALASPFIQLLLVVLALTQRVTGSHTVAAFSNTVNTTWDQYVGEHKIAGPNMLPAVAIPAGEASRWLLYSINGSNKLAVCGVANKPFCVVDNQGVALTEYVSPLMLGAGVHTLKARAAGAITAGRDIYAAANGQVQMQPTSAGAYYRIGRSLTTVTVADDIIEFIPDRPQYVVIVAAGTTAQAAIVTTPTTQSTPFGFATQAQGDNLVTLVNQLRVDMLAFQAGEYHSDTDSLEPPALVLPLTGTPTPG